MFSDIPQYLEARDYLKERGYGVLIDGLNQQSLQLLDPGALNADYYKVGWDVEYAETESDKDHAAIGNLIDGIGQDSIILTRAESQDAVRWGLTLGVRRFQGFLIDTLVNFKTEKNRKRPSSHRQTGQGHQGRVEYGNTTGFPGKCHVTRSSPASLSSVP